MDLIVFDLDGTLLNSESKVSTYTRETLEMLTRRSIAYTVATGRTMYTSREPLAGHGFELPHVYKNGVVIWHPEESRFSDHKTLTADEVARVNRSCMDHGVSPFVFTLDEGQEHGVYHGPLQSQAEEKLKKVFLLDRGLHPHPLNHMPATSSILNVSAMGPQPAIQRVADFVSSQAQLVSYSGPAFEEQNLYWIDIHHSAASKGDAVEVVRKRLGFERVICFGDSDNDLSMFATADECYAPSNALESLKAKATQVIGHHHEDGVARFLRQRFDLG